METRDAARVAGVADEAEERALRDGLSDVEPRPPRIELRVEEEHRAFADDEDDLAAARLLFDARDDAPPDRTDGRAATREEIGALVRAVEAVPRRVEIMPVGGVRDAVDGDGQRDAGRRVRRDERDLDDDEDGQALTNEPFRSHPCLCRKATGASDNGLVSERSVPAGERATLVLARAARIRVRLRLRRMLPRLSAAILALGGAVMLAGSMPACSSNDPNAIEKVCPEGQPCSVNLTILHTSDIHSRLFPYEQVITQVDATLGLGDLNTVSNIGGVARMAYILNRERARSGRVIHLDSGDSFQGAPVGNIFRGEPETRAMSALGADGVVIANHEFDFGAQNLVNQFQRWGGFTALAANYRTDPVINDTPVLARLNQIAKAFVIHNVGGLKIAVIGMANLSSLTSIFDQPNRLGITPLNTVEVAQFYIDLLRPYVDVVGFVTHLGLEVDQRMVRGTTGADFVMGGHNHVVINPPQEIKDCSADPNNPGFVWAVDPNLNIDPNAAPPQDDLHPDPVNHPYAFKRACKPRRVLIAHSGAFAKYVGRLDLVVTNNPSLASPTGNPADYDPVNGFEVQSLRYQAFPVNATVPEDPVLIELLQPYQRGLDNAVDLDILVGYSPLGSRRFSTAGGDSPLGNVVGNAIWLRLGIQTDFSLTNSTGIRTDLNPGPITVEQMFNIFPFDNSISKMQLSGGEVQELFDFAARRSARRGCASQIQIAGARVRINCSGCERTKVTCSQDSDCTAIGRDACLGGECTIRCQTDEQCSLRLKGSTCNREQGACDFEACAEQVYIGQTGKTCSTDVDCSDDPNRPLPESCQKAEGKATGRCLSLIKETNLYELATSNYLAGGGSGFRVLQRNTTQFDTKIQQRDALIDYIRAGRPCGWSLANNTPDGLKVCATDADCGDPQRACACEGHVAENRTTPQLTCETQGQCGPGAGRCVLRSCREDVARFHIKRCDGAPDLALCQNNVGACQLGGESCKILACIDSTLGSFTDNRVRMLGR